MDGPVGSQGYRHHALDTRLDTDAQSEPFAPLAHVSASRLRGIERAALQSQEQPLRALAAIPEEGLDPRPFEMLARLAAAAEFRDDDTGQHTRRVGDLSVTIAQHVGVSEANVELAASPHRCTTSAGSRFPIPSSASRTS